MVGESQSQIEYDEEWENLLDSGILEDLLQKAEHENAVRRASQVVPTFSTPQPVQPPVPPPNLLFDSQIHPPQPIIGPVSNAVQVCGRAQLHTENAFNTRSQTLHGSRKPPLPFELRGSQGYYYQDRHEGAHLPINLSQVPTQGPGSFRSGAPANGAVNIQNQPPNGVPGSYRDDGLHVNEVLAEKNGTISVLRSKLMQADSELYELRKRVAAQTSSQHGPQFQQRELERLSLELNLKDQEVLEARRARDDKNDRLRDALSKAAALEKELENLRKPRKIDVGGSKRCREEGEYEAVNRAGPSYSQGDEPEEENTACSGRPLEGTYAHMKDQSKRLDQAQEVWAAPWEAENVAAHKAVTSKESSDAAVLKARTVDDGCVTSNQKKTRVIPPQASELPCRGHISVRNGAFAALPQQEASGRGLGLENGAIQRELTHILQQIWNPKGSHSESVSLVSELFAVCRQDLYILSTYEGTLKKSVKSQIGSKSISGLKRKQTLHNEPKKEIQESVGSNFHSALAKVANKLLPTATLFGPLLEYCNCDNIDLVQSALRVVHCILRHDSFCREKVLASSKHVGVSRSFSRLNLSFEGRGWSMFSGDMRQDQASVPVFSSPRVFCGLPKPQNETSLGLPGPEQAELRRNTTGVEDGANMVSPDLNPFVEWLLYMAAHSSNTGVRFEASAIMGLLVAHSEPVSQRAQFGPLLWGKKICKFGFSASGEQQQVASLASLLIGTAGVAVQLQAIRLVHLLLHCPVLLQMFCSALDTSLGDSECTSKPRDPGVEECETHIQGLDIVGRGECKRVLDGISSCLEYPGSSLQEYVIRRDAIRVLAYLASSGDSAVRILLCAQIKLEQCGTFKESNSADGGIGLQSENPRAGSRMNASTGDVAAAHNSHVGVNMKPVTSEDGEKLLDIPCRLISLLARELKSEADESPTIIERLDIEEHRACLIRETVSLFSKLLSNQQHSRELLDSIISNQETTRLILSVIDQLISRGSQSRPGASSSTDLVELARGLQNRIVPEL